MAKVNIIGSGFSSLSAAALLALEGHSVSIFEKNETIGGRARKFSAKGFVFDMGPSWYWMPDVFEDFFNLFGKSASDYYQLVKLDPAFRIFYGERDFVDIPDNFEELCQLFENLEKGSSAQLKKFMAHAQYKYQVGMKDLVYKPGNSLLEFATWPVLKGVFKLDLLTSFDKYVKSHFKHPKLIALMEFPVLFLGAMPSETPALYSLMNYAGLRLGTWYPMGGMHKIVESMESLLKTMGVQIHTQSAVTSIRSAKGLSTEIVTSQGAVGHDALIAGADYHHIEQEVVEKADRKYSPKYWESRSLSPSCLLAYVGVSKKVKNLLHHNLFFHENFEQHAVEIYKTPQWPSKPLFYLCCPSKTDPAIAPEGHENLFFLMPLAPGLKDTQEARQKYFDLMLSKAEELTGENIKEAIVYQKLYCVDDFQKDYNAYKGNAYGLSNTLRQTAMFKPKMKSSKLKNLFYAGHLTVPGPGVPPALISGQIAAKEVSSYLLNL